MGKPVPNLAVMTRLLGSWFGSGLILRALRGEDTGSGTLASVVAFPVLYLLGDRIGWVAQAVAAALLVALSLWVTHRLAGDAGDAGWIVVDEVAGTAVATIGLAFGPALLGLMVFRLTDIFKRSAPGVARAERLPGGWGITGDDVVAGLYGLAAGHLANLFM